MFWQKDIETMPRGELEALQLDRLRTTVRHVYDNVAYMRQKLDARGLGPDSVKSLDDIRRFPFTTKDDLRVNYPFGLFAAPRRDIVRVHASSGTTGKPTVVGYTRRDMDMWANIIARLAAAAGVCPEDTAQISFGYGLFTGGFGLHQGLEKLGVAVIPMSSGNSERQLMIMEDFEPTVLVATPSYAVYLGELARKAGIKPKLRVGLFGGEGATDGMREKIEKDLGLFATDNYGMSELVGPGVSGECEHRCGLHIAEDHFLAEIIDPESGECLGEGETGELVITSLTKEALPIIRYRTRDIASITLEPCACGRTHARMSRVTGRTDDMLIIKGVNVFPSQIEGVLMSVPNVGPHYQLILRREGFLDTLEVNVELIDGSVLELYSALEAVQSGIKRKLHSVLGLDVKVNLVDAGTIERSLGKAKRVIDLRNT